MRVILPMTSSPTYEVVSPASYVSSPTLICQFANILSNWLSERDWRHNLCWLIQQLCKTIWLLVLEEPNGNWMSCLNTVDSKFNKVLKASSWSKCWHHLNGPFCSVCLFCYKCLVINHVLENCLGGFYRRSGNANCVIQWTKSYHCQ